MFKMDPAEPGGGDYFRLHLGCVTGEGKPKPVLQALLTKALRFVVAFCG